jgi:hypothetical protein
VPGLLRRRVVERTIARDDRVVIASVREGADVGEDIFDLVQSGTSIISPPDSRGLSIPSWERLTASGRAGVYQRNH